MSGMSYEARNKITDQKQRRNLPKYSREGGMSEDTG